MSKAASGTAEARRYKRPIPYTEARPHDRALVGDFKDGEGDPATLAAVLNARREQLDASAPEETTQEAIADLRALARELEDFPTLHDFIYEALAWRVAAATRGDLLDTARRELVRTHRELETTRKERNVDKSDAETSQTRYVEVLKKLDTERQQRRGNAIVKELALEFGCSESNVRYAIKTLRERGELSQEKRRHWATTDADKIRDYLRINCRDTRGKKKL